VNILRVIASVDPRGGGPSEGLRRTAESMSQLGHTTEVVTLDAPGAPFLEGTPFVVHPQGRLIQRYGYTPKLSRWVRSNAHRFDVAILHGLWNHASVGAWLGLRGTGLPYFQFVHGMMDPWFRDAYPFKHAAKQAFWLAVQGRTLRDAKAVLFTSEEERQRARGVFFGYRYSERVVLYGAARPPDQPEAQRQAIKQVLPKLGDRPYILFLGRIHPKKGCDLLVNAFARIAEQFPAMDLVIAGPDQVGITADLQAVAARLGISTRLHWPGMLTGNAKWGAFRGAAAFVLPSHQENFGISVAEALACGTPVLISDKVNIWREIQQGGAGLVDSDTLAGTERLLSAFLSLDERETSQMRVSAVRTFDRYFDAENAANALVEVIST